MRVNYLECSCFSPQHALRFVYDFDGNTRDLYIETYLEKLPFTQRFKNFLNILNNEDTKDGVFGNWMCMIQDKNTYADLRKIINLLQKKVLLENTCVYEVKEIVIVEGNFHLKFKYDEKNLEVHSEICFKKNNLYDRFFIATKYLFGSYTGWKEWELDWQKSSNLQMIFKSLINDTKNHNKANPKKKDNKETTGNLPESSPILPTGTESNQIQNG